MHREEALCDVNVTLSGKEGGREVGVRCDEEAMDAKRRRKEDEVKGRREAKRKICRYMSQARDKGNPTASPLVSSGLKNTR